ncbi:MAG: DUF5615 family PIN-like protein [Candidatus Methylomirabilia bacterium]
MKPAGRSGLPEPTLLLDENLSGTKVHALLDAAGIKSVSFHSILLSGATDFEVITVAIERNLVIVTRDKDFKYHPAISSAFRASAARCIHVVATGAGVPHILRPC